MVSRRGFLIGGGAVAGVAAAGAVGWELAPAPVTYRVRRTLGLLPEPYVPDVPEGTVTVERVVSEHLGDIDLFTAVPAGYGDGAGLPVVVVLHGSSATAAGFQDLGLARFVTAAVEAGAPPFVLAGTDDGPAGWVPVAGADPQAMLRDELPGWLTDRGVRRRPARALGLVARRVRRAALRRGRADLGLGAGAVQPGAATRATRPSPTAPASGCSATCRGACGAARTTRSATAPRRWPRPPPPRPTRGWAGPGGHTRVYWNAQTVDMLTWLTQHL